MGRCSLSSANRHARRPAQLYHLACKGPRSLGQRAGCNLRSKSAALEVLADQSFDARRIAARRKADLSQGLAVGFERPAHGGKGEIDPGDLVPIEKLDLE